MNLVELDHALRQLRLSGMADVLTRACAKPKPNARRPSISSRLWSAMSSYGGKIGSSRGGCSRRAFATPTARWIRLISTSTRR